MGPRSFFIISLILLVFTYAMAAAGPTKKVEDLGVSPDCSELPVSVSDLDALAKSPKITSMLDFLQAIPKGSLQNFTFIQNSESLQRGGDNGSDAKSNIVNPMWPRVLRFSTDGKLTLGFVCDPGNSAYGTVEAIYFDDSTQKLVTKEWQFTNKGEAVAPASRIHDSPDTCLACHNSRNGTADPAIKFNWPQYFVWSDCDRDRGISTYGSDDDRMGTSTYREVYLNDSVPADCTDAKYSAEHTQEAADYKKFRQTQMSNACFNSLPWPSTKTRKDLASYPYPNSDVEAQDYTLRTNLRFTDALSQITAKRDFRLLKNAGPAYDVMKYYLAMESAECLTVDDRQKISQMLSSEFGAQSPGASPLPTSSYGNAHPQPALLEAFAKTAGFTAGDWSLEFNNKAGNTDYNAGDNYSTGQLVAGSILRDIAADNPTVAAVANSVLFNAIINETSQAQGKDYSCIDKDGGSIGGILFDQRKLGTGSPICTTLRSENEKNLPGALDRFEKSRGPASLRKKN